MSAALVAAAERAMNELFRLDKMHGNQCQTTWETAQGLKDALKLQAANPAEAARPMPVAWINAQGDAISAAVKRIWQESAWESGPAKAKDYATPCYTSHKLIDPMAAKAADEDTEAWRQIDALNKSLDSRCAELEQENDRLRAAAQPVAPAAEPVAWVVEWREGSNNFRSVYFDKREMDFEPGDKVTPLHAAPPAAKPEPAPDSKNVNPRHGSFPSGREFADAVKLAVTPDWIEGWTACMSLAERRLPSLPESNAKTVDEQVAGLMELVESSDTAWERYQRNDDLEIENQLYQEWHLSRASIEAYARAMAQGAQR